MALTSKRVSAALHPAVAALVRLLAEAAAAKAMHPSGPARELKATGAPVRQGRLKAVSPSAQLGVREES
jgi:hypothetical protein